jgi:hypothetical protein
MTGILRMKAYQKIWKCDCGNDDQTKIIFTFDGEVVCGKCATVLGQYQLKSEENKDEIDPWDAQADLCRKILEDRVSKKGWEF